MVYQNLAQTDPELWSLIKEETERQKNGIELIASENYVSAAVFEALATSLTNKYSEGYPGKRYYGGNEIIDQVENLAISRAKKLFGAEHVNVQPLSGSPANAAVYQAFLKPGDKVLALKLDHGGHLTHGHALNFSGKLYDFVPYEVDPETEEVNLDTLMKLAQEIKPKMIVAGFSAYSRSLDWEKIAAIAKEVDAYSFADISHIAGLIAAGLLASPVPYFDVVSTTTHKTLRGPRGAIIMCRAEHAAKIDQAVFPGTQGGPHENVIAAKAVAFLEAVKPEWKDYGRQILVNAQTLATELQARGYRLVSGGTDNHLLIIDLRPQGLSGKEAEKILEKIGISVSRSTIPNDPNPPLKASGLRLGTPAVTTRGFKEVEIKKLAALIDKALKSGGDENILADLKKETAALAEGFPIPGF
ncbi:MAG: serine hydroxymethyltransferase [Candidatus Parcubacteria bacterium]|jgi:glycine hydroxymethyltransferase|nr:MAG: serine hydroxymethyltransferase [Candidatus Parcubacteria bacterium]